MSSPAAAARPSNRGFWTVLVAFGIGSVAVVVLVIVFRPVARTGAVAFAQRNLRTAADAADRVAELEGSLAAATATRLRAEPEAGRLLFIHGDTASNDSEVVSVTATESSWTGAARADTGECFWIRLEVRGARVLGTGTECSGEAAAEARAGSWPEP